MGVADQPDLARDKHDEAMTGSHIPRALAGHDESGLRGLTLEDAVPLLRLGSPELRGDRRRPRSRRGRSSHRAKRSARRPGRRNRCQVAQVEVSIRSQRQQATQPFGFRLVASAGGAGARCDRHPERTRGHPGCGSGHEKAATLETVHRRACTVSVEPSWPDRAAQAWSGGGLDFTGGDQIPPDTVRLDE